MLIQSLYTHFFENNNKYFLYNALSGFFCEISSKTYEHLYNREYSLFSQETIDLFINNDVLIPEENKYLFYLGSKSQFNGENNNDSAIGLVIAPTIQCNFNCPYCFESKSNTSFMTDETESHLIGFIQNHKNVKAMNLTWYGGEPLLAFNRIKSIWNRFLQEIPNIRIQNHSIITNGWLITEDVVDFFKQSSLDFIQITLDGDKENHNKTRCLKDGSPTFDHILNNIIKLAKDIPSLEIAIRVNINRLNAQDYIKIFKLLKGYKLKNISVYPGFIREDTIDGHALSFNTLTGTSYYKFYKSLSQDGVRKNFFPNLCNSKGCLMSSAYAFIIGPEGELYKCWNDVGHKNRIIGNILNNMQSDKLRLYRYLNETSAFSDERCKDCSVFPICDGGCGHYRYRNNFEDGNFDLCTHFKDRSILEESLLLSIVK